MPQADIGGGLGTQEFTRRDVWHLQVRSDPLGLRSLASARWSDEDADHPRRSVSRWTLTPAASSIDGGLGGVLQPNHEWPPTAHKSGRWCASDLA